LNAFQSKPIGPFQECVIDAQHLDRIVLYPIRHDVRGVGDNELFRVRNPAFPANSRLIFKKENPGQICYLLMNDK
jgi:hypothetical protein